MTNGALGGKCLGAYTNIRRSPGFAPNPVISRNRVGRAGATRAGAAFFRADARRPSNLLRNAWRPERISRGSLIGEAPIAPHKYYCALHNRDPLGWSQDFFGGHFGMSDRCPLYPQ